MKLSTFLTFGALASSVAILAQESYPIDSISCAVSNADSCCVPSYGVIVLTQQWIPGYGPKDAFTLHVLWPNTCSGGQGPADGCDTSRAYKNVGTNLQSFNSSLYSQMNTYWTSYNSDNGVFCPKCYGSSYQKHEDMIDYFQSVLSLRSKYNLHGALAKADIVPGGTYTQTAMANAIKSALGITPYFKCKSGTINEI
ncbi:hypothetical protein K7432_016896 [Basidiobolus ranarum]|uniref:Uncharacterized protein n=1 Tax=Basidiobolus ranarum TaxID=34480 RepID=A0ABR2VL01_9FUNG